MAHTKTSSKRRPAIQPEDPRIAYEQERALKGVVEAILGAKAWEARKLPGVLLIATGLTLPEEDQGLSLISHGKDLCGMENEEVLDLATKLATPARLAAVSRLLSANWNDAPGQDHVSVYDVGLGHHVRERHPGFESFALTKMVGSDRVSQVEALLDGGGATLERVPCTGLPFADGKAGLLSIALRYGAYDTASSVWKRMSQAARQAEAAEAAFALCWASAPTRKPATSAHPVQWMKKLLDAGATPLAKIHCSPFVEQFLSPSWLREKGVLGMFQRSARIMSVPVRLLDLALWSCSSKDGPQQKILGMLLDGVDAPSFARSANHAGIFSLDLVCDHTDHPGLHVDDRLSSTWTDFIGRLASVRLPPSSSAILANLVPRTLSTSSTPEPWLTLSLILTSHGACVEEAALPEVFAQCARNSLVSLPGIDEEMHGRLKALAPIAGPHEGRWLSLCDDLAEAATKARAGEHQNVVSQRVSVFLDTLSSAFRQQPGARQRL